MRILTVILSVFAFGLTFGAHADITTASAEDAQSQTIITANVKGMVCDFCARAVNKVFKKEKAVTAVDVNLDKGAIVIKLVEGAELTDARIGELVEKSGYVLVDVKRSGA